MLGKGLTITFHTNQLIELIFMLASLTTTVPTCTVFSIKFSDHKVTPIHLLTLSSTKGNLILTFLLKKRMPCKCFKTYNHF